MQAVEVLWSDVPEGLRPTPKLIAKWVSSWADDPALLRCLVELKRGGYFARGYAYVQTCLASAFANGKRIPAVGRPGPQQHGADATRLQEARDLDRRLGLSHE